MQMQMPLQLLLLLSACSFHCSPLSWQTGSEKKLGTFPIRGVACCVGVVAQIPRVVGGGVKKLRKWLRQSRKLGKDAKDVEPGAWLRFLSMNDGRQDTVIMRNQWAAHPR